jgi:hypothetical protein
MNVPGGQYINLIMQNAATATGNGTAMDITAATRGAMSVLAMQVTGITTATITFEATIDGSNWVSILAENVTSGAEAATATANGIYRITALSMVQIRARISAYTSGTITVIGVLVP